MRLIQKEGHLEKKYYFTSESVTEGHPDKLCDKISDAVLDHYLEQDPDSRVACEVCVTTGLVVAMGEISSKAEIDVDQVIRRTIRDVGYTSGEIQFHADDCRILNVFDQQSEDISMGVNRMGEVPSIGAGDQGLVFGYAVNEAEEYMPLAASLAHRLAQKLTSVRKEGVLEYLYPDGKTQVTVEYDSDKRPVRIDTVVLSAHHQEWVTQEQIHSDLVQQVVTPVIPQNLLDSSTRFLVNPTGRFVNGGPHADTGLTGRKIIVDTYGGYGRHGGGAFSGKDYTKVDRSASYAARYLAKNIVASGLANECEIQIAYAIGVERPVSLFVNTFGTGKVSDRVVETVIANQFDLTPSGIIQMLDLKKPIYTHTAAYGHFGRTDILFPWEKTDQIILFRNLYA